MNNDLLFLNTPPPLPPRRTDKAMALPLQVNHGPQTNSNFQSLIDWVNSFNDPYCLLVNSLNDLRDGKVS